MSAPNPTEDPFHRLRELFEEEWELSRYPFATTPRASVTPFDPDRCPAGWLTPGVVQRAMRGSRREELAAMVRTSLHHRLGADMSRVHAPLLDQYTQKIVATLERARDRAASIPPPRDAGSAVGSDHVAVP